MSGKVKRSKSSLKSSKRNKLYMRKKSLRKRKSRKQKKSVSKHKRQYRRKKTLKIKRKNKLKGGAWPTWGVQCKCARNNCNSADGGPNALNSHNKMPLEERIKGQQDAEDGTKGYLTQGRELRAEIKKQEEARASIGQRLLAMEKAQPNESVDAGEHSSDVGVRWGSDIAQESEEYKRIQSDELFPILDELKRLHTELSKIEKKITAASNVYYLQGSRDPKWNSETRNCDNIHYGPRMGDDWICSACRVPDSMAAGLRADKGK